MRHTIDLGQDVRKAGRPAGRNVVHVVGTLADDDANAWLSLISEGTGGPSPRLVIDLDGRDAAGIGWTVPPGAEVISLGIRRLSNPAGWLKLLRRLRAAPEDTVHLHLTNAIVMAAPLARLLGKRVVVTLYCEDRSVPRGLRKAILYRIETLCLRYFTDAVLAVGPQVLASNLARLGSVRTIVLPPLLRFPTPRPARTRQMLRQTLGAVADDTVLLSADRLELERDPMTLLAAFAEVQAANPATMLWIAGDGALSARVRAAVECLDIAGRVRLLGRPGDLSGLMAAADVFVSTPLTAGFPAPLAEAAACGLPIVATRVGDIAGIVGPGCGLLVKPGHPKELSAALLALSRSRALRRRLGGNALALNRRSADPSAWQEAFTDVYRNA